MCLKTFETLFQGLVFKVCYKHSTDLPQSVKGSLKNTKRPFETSPSDPPPHSLRLLLVSLFGGPSFGCFTVPLCCYFASLKQHPVGEQTWTERRYNIFSNIFTHELFLFKHWQIESETWTTKPLNKQTFFPISPRTRRCFFEDGGSTNFPIPCSLIGAMLIFQLVYTLGETEMEKVHKAQRPQDS